MKANQAFRSDEEAVSPVVGVILMVAITVVLAAVVFVLVNNLGKGSSAKPTIGFLQDQTAHTLTVNSAETADWKDIGYKLTNGAGATCSGTVTTGGTAYALTTAGGTMTGATSAVIKANDIIKIAN